MSPNGSCFAELTGVERGVRTHGSLTTRERRSKGPRQGPWAGNPHGQALCVHHEPGP